jgi:Zinc knuckle
LQRRFGKEGQGPIYRSQLRNRRRAKGESIHEVYDDVVRLMYLAYPGRQTEQGDTVAIDAFLTALDDDALETRVRDHLPATLDDAYRTALVFEANSRSRSSRERSEEFHNRFEHQVRAAGSEIRCKDQADAAAAAQLELSARHEREISLLKATLEDVLRRTADTHQCPAVKPLSMVTPAPPASARGRGCYECGDDGHFARDCPARKTAGDRRSFIRHTMTYQSGAARENFGVTRVFNRTSCRGGACFRCGKVGHLVRSCLKERYRAPGRCRKKKRAVLEAPVAAAARIEDAQSVYYRCRGVSHRAESCPDRESDKEREARRAANAGFGGARLKEDRSEVMSRRRRGTAGGARDGDPPGPQTRSLAVSSLDPAALSFQPAARTSCVVVQQTGCQEESLLTGEFTSDEGVRIGGIRAVEQVEEPYTEDGPELSDEEWRAADILTVEKDKQDNEVLSAGYDDAVQRKLEGYFSAGGRIVDMYTVFQDLLKQHPEVELPELAMRVRVAGIRAMSTSAIVASIRSM